MEIARARGCCLPGSAMYIMYMILAILVWVFTFTGRADAITWDQTKHGNPVSGVDRSGAPYPTGDCAHCHDILDASICAGGPPYQFAAVDVLCFLPECHLYIQQIYAISTDTLVGGINATGYYTTVNTKHDVLDSDQAYSGAKLECINCHATHRGADPSVDPSQNILCDPDDKYTAFTHTVIHPGTGQPVFDSDMFCSRCHDGTWTNDGTVIGPTTIKNTSITYHNTGSQGDSHGEKMGVNPMVFT